MMAAITMVELFHQSGPQNAFSLAMDEDNACAFIFQICVHDMTEFIHLTVEDVGRTHSVGIVNKVLNMKIHNDGSR